MMNLPFSDSYYALLSWWHHGGYPSCATLPGLNGATQSRLTWAGAVPGVFSIHQNWSVNQLSTVNSKFLGLKGTITVCTIVMCRFFQASPWFAKLGNLLSRPFGNTTVSADTSSEEIGHQNHLRRRGRKRGSRYRGGKKSRDHKNTT